jgi:hypothetical protein
MNRLIAVVDIGSLPLSPGKTISATFPSLGSLVTVIIKNSMTLAGILFLLLLIFGGLTFIMGAGNNDPKKSAQGQELITDALVGFVIIMMAYFIVQIIETVTGLKILDSGL